jgi:hypothetical protein
VNTYVTGEGQDKPNVIQNSSPPSMPVLVGQLSNFRDRLACLPAGMYVHTVTYICLEICMARLHAGDLAPVHLTADLGDTNTYVTGEGQGKLRAIENNSP